MPKTRTLILMFSAWLALVILCPIAGLSISGGAGQGLHPLIRSDTARNADPSRWVRGIEIGFARTRVTATFVNAEEAAKSTEPSWLQSHGLSIHPVPWSLCTTNPFPHDLPLQTVVLEEMFGWPMRMVGLRSISRPPTNDHGDVVVTKSGGADAVLYAPSPMSLFAWWPGIVCNLLLGPAVILAFCKARSTYFSWRASQRYAKGQCPACGHSQEGIPEGSVCPECGSTSAFDRSAVG
ncbi:MAG TPA: hypothetical protein PKE29_17605 [Phycisphaerales bacterium]|nr:hypothetical protein [Phycisphaerales bacterium]